MLWRWDYQGWRKLSCQRNTALPGRCQSRMYPCFFQHKRPCLPMYLHILKWSRRMRVLVQETRWHGNLIPLDFPCSSGGKSFFPSRYLAKSIFWYCFFLQTFPFYEILRHSSTRGEDDKIKGFWIGIPRKMEGLLRGNLSSLRHVDRLPQDTSFLIARKGITLFLGSLYRG